MSNTAAAVAPKSDFAVATLAHAKLRALQPSKRSNAFRKLAPHIRHLVTEECKGEAHSNAHIDYCMCCLNYSWSRSLKRSM